MSTSAPCTKYLAGRLTLGGVALEEIAREVGTPAYVYSAEEIARRFGAVDAAFSGRDHLVCYAMKANSNGEVCRLLSALGAGADVVSGGELKRALQSGFNPREIVFSGVGKTEEEISLALQTGIYALNVESGEELDAIARVAGRLNVRARFSVRLNPGVDAGTHRHITTGRLDNKFGVDFRGALELYARARKDRRLLAVGMQSHIGSQIKEIRPYREAMKVMLRLVSRLAEDGQRLEYVDMGGGFGVTYHDEPEIPLAALAKEALGQLKAWPGLRLLVEPGRYLTADAGVLLATVLYRKTTGRSRFVIVDAAMNDLLRPALYEAYHPILPARRSRAKAVRLDVVGPVCETADSLAKNRLMPWPEPGDLLVVLKTGAYGFSMSSQYNSRPRPPEVMVDRGLWKIIRSRETFDDLVGRER